MNTYCERQGRLQGSVRFMYEGRRIEPHESPESLDMEDGDMIEAQVEQTGGGLDDEPVPKDDSVPHSF